MKRTGMCQVADVRIEERGPAGGVDRLEHFRRIAARVVAGQSIAREAFDDEVTRRERLSRQSIVYTTDIAPGHTIFI
jgi:hypothetical protein